MSSNKKKKNKLLKVSIVLYIVLIAVIGVYSVAWFVTNKRVEIGVNEEINIAVGNNLEIALIEKTTTTPSWRSKITLNTETDKNYPDVTAGLVGDELSFYYPTVLDDSDKVLSDSGYLVGLSGQEGYYIQIRLKFRTSVNMGVYLTNESFVKPIDTTKEDSQYGSISTDYIAGAARISFSEVTETDENGNIVKEQLKNIWIPNDKYELYYSDVVTGLNGETTSKAFIKADGERERFYRDIMDENDPNYQSELPYGYLSVINDEVRYNAWSEMDYCNKLITVGNDYLASQGVNNVPVINSAKELLTFTATTDSMLQEKELVVRIWFEGTDRESEKALNGGKVNYNFQFLGIDKKDASEEMQNKLTSLLYKSDGKIYINDTTATETDNLLYSYNGIDWNRYVPTGNNEAPLKDNVKDYVYVKIRETVSNKETDFVQLIKQN